MKKFNKDWKHTPIARPSYPQVYVIGEFVERLGIVKEQKEHGELLPPLKEKINKR